MKKKDCPDEEIIRLQRFYRESTIWRNPFTEGFKAGGRIVKFTPRLFFEDRVRIWIPEDFTEMPEPVAKARYISDCRPPLILTNPNYDENFGFHLLEAEELTGELGVDERIGQMQDAVLRHAPGTVVYSRGSIPADGKRGSWFEYKNFTLDDETYNLQFLIDFKTHWLAGTFNCMMCDYGQWKKPVLKSLEAIELNLEGGLR